MSSYSGFCKTNGFVRAIAAIAALTILAGSAAAEPTFSELVKKLPKTTNAVVILNVEKIKKCPMAVAENWAENLEKSYESGLTKIPPHATQFVIGADLDPEFMKPIYETAVVELDMRASLDTVAKVHGGTRDKLDDFDALVLPQDTYVIQFDPKTIGVMRPANRQAVLRWLRSMDLAAGPQLSVYIMQAAGYADTTGSEIIIAVDLDGAFSWERGAKYVDRKKELLEKYGVEVKNAADLMATLKGLRVGIRLTEKPIGEVIADFGDEVKLPNECARQLMLDVFADAGILIPELEQWTCEVQGTTVALKGAMNRDALRRMGSLIDSPHFRTRGRRREVRQPRRHAGKQAEGVSAVLSCGDRHVQRYQTWVARPELAFQRFRLSRPLFAENRQASDSQRRSRSA